MSSLHEEQISLQETEVAKLKLPKLHGRNYGRSLTLEMDNDTLPFLSSKWIIIGLIIAIGLGAVGLVERLRVLSSHNILLFYFSFNHLLRSLCYNILTIISLHGATIFFIVHHLYEPT